MKSAGHKTAEVPMLDLSRQYASIREEVLAANCPRVRLPALLFWGLRSSPLNGSLPPCVGQLMAVGCASGTMLFWLAMVAAGVHSGDVVITTPFSFFASASSILRAGARPVFADVDPETLNLDPIRVEQRLKLSPRTSAPSCRSIFMASAWIWMAWNRVAAEFKLLVIEDAAQAVGATWKGRPARRTRPGCGLQLLSHEEPQRFWRCRAVTTDDHLLAQHMRYLRDTAARSATTMMNRRQQPVGRDPGRRAAREDAPFAELE